MFPAPQRRRGRCSIAHPEGGRRGGSRPPAEATLSLPSDHPADVEARPGLPTAAFDYELPADRIAQTPLPDRAGSRLLHLPPKQGCEDRRFRDLPGLLRPGDLLVVNTTRVRAARLRGERAGGGAAELLVLGRRDQDGYDCLVRPARRLPDGTAVSFGAGLQATVLGIAEGHGGARLVRFDAGGGDIDAAIEAHGSVPLPPYIRAPLEDADRYQTLHAQGAPISAAAPTAGLHFTAEIRAALDARGVGWAEVSLEVGLGTFAPIVTARVADHAMHREHCSVPEVTAARIAQTRASGGRVIAVGTTVVRTLETMAVAGGTVRAGAADTSLYITPGDGFAVVDGLLTNFHQPQSSLVVLVAAFVGTERWRQAYAHALAADYRFLSFGDCMLCWRRQA